MIHINFSIACRALNSVQFNIYKKDPYFTLIGFIKFVAKSWRTELQVSISGFHRSSEKYDSVFRRTSVHVPGYLQRKTYIDPDEGKEKQLEVRR